MVNSLELSNCLDKIISFMVFLAAGNFQKISKVMVNSVEVSNCLDVIVFMVFLTAGNFSRDIGSDDEFGGAVELPGCDFIYGTPHGREFSYVFELRF